MKELLRLYGLVVVEVEFPHFLLYSFARREILVPVLTRYVMGKEERLQETGGLKDKVTCFFIM